MMFKPETILEILNNAKNIHVAKGPDWHNGICVNLVDILTTMDLSFHARLDFFSQINIVRFKPKNKNVGDIWWPMNSTGYKKRLKVLNSLIDEYETLHTGLHSPTTERSDDQQDYESL